MVLKANSQNIKQMDFSEYFEIFLMNDHPTTCPKCGCRTDLICDLPDSMDLAELHICLSNSCKFVFIVEEDTEIQNML